jgi:hypothetical protein
LELKDRFDFNFDPNIKMMVRREKIQRDLENYSKQPFKNDTAIYVYGKDNEKAIKGFGFKTVLIDSNPYMFHPTKLIYKHKLHAYQYMMDDFDEVVFLDVDMRLTKSLPIDFWETLGKKESIQACLHSYSKARINYRKGKANKIIPFGAFLYMRDKSIPEKLLKFHELLPNKFSCEPTMAMLTDEMSGGWKGIDYYWDHFEPIYWNCRKSPYKWNKEKYKKDTCFKHCG